MEKLSDVEELSLRVVEINGGVFGSTGKIMFSIAKAARESGMEVMCASPITSTNRNQDPEEEYYKIGSYNGRRLSVLLGTVTGYNGCFSYIATKKLLKEIAKFHPDIIHLHNLHNCYINLPMLFKFIKKNHIRTIWTLHDCWAFTGNCPHFTLAKCDKWQKGCYKCPQYKKYPASIFDNSTKMWKLKKKWFTGVENMTIVTPSQWLANLVKKSILKEYPVEIINNGIDLNIFKPTQSDIRRQLGIKPNKYLVLGVAFGWNYKKGLDVFCSLPKMLGDNYQVVLVGTDEDVDLKLPSNIISIHRTESPLKLAELYSAADVMVNPSREDTFGMVNIESISCGTPVVMFSTGGCPECIDSKSGVVVPQDDIEKMVYWIKRICEKKELLEKDCVYRATSFSNRVKSLEYLELYKG
ncbi:MAG: glycosyltransferase [Oscillospiraceae bacterium]|nr:glycosyltransferase [Oscillospiraceae bacterium]